MTDEHEFGTGMGGVARRAVPWETAGLCHLHGRCGGRLGGLG